MQARQQGSLISHVQGDALYRPVAMPRPQLGGAAVPMDPHDRMPPLCPTADSAAPGEGLRGLLGAAFRDADAVQSEVFLLVAA